MKTSRRNTPDGPRGVAIQPCPPALALTTWAASLLAWLYLTMRIVIHGIDPPDPFLPGVPFLSFIRAGAISFGLFCVSMFAYLWLWGRFDRGLFVQGSSGYREP